MRDMVVLIGAETPSGRAVAKKLRAERFFCKLMRSNTPVADIAALDASGIVIAGEASEGAAAPDAALLRLGLPVLAVGSSARVLLGAIGQKIAGEVVRTVMPVFYKETSLFEGVGSGERWVERAEYYDVQAPYTVVAESDGMPLGFADLGSNIYLMQFQIERNDPDGMAMLRAFAGPICGCTQWWTAENIAAAARDAIVKDVGDGEAVCAMSGGLDSTVAAMLARSALGARARCIFVDTGLLREGEAAETERYFADELGLDFKRVDASERILEALSSLTGMDEKWDVIDREITGALIREASAEGKGFTFIKGTNYADILAGEPKESGDYLTIAPLNELFKDEIRMLGRTLGISDAVLSRQPFPGMGLAARIHGEVTAERLHVLRRADKIFNNEIIDAGQERRVDRYFAMFDEVDGHTVIILRALQGAEPSMNVARLPHDLMERTVEYIRTELPVVERVMYDMTPGMAEW